MASFVDRARKAWDVFRGRDPTDYRSSYGPGYSRRPDRSRLYFGGEKSIVNAVYTRIAIDVSAVGMEHAKKNDDGFFEETIQSPLNDCLGLSANLERSYNAAFNRLSPIHDVRVCNLRYNDVQPVINQSRDMSKSTVSNMIIVCRMVSAYAQKCEYASTDFSAHLSGNYTDSKEIHHPFTHDEIMRLWKDKSQTAARFALVTVYTGLRPSELLGASVSLSDITRGYFTAGSKTEAGRDRIIPIHPDIKPVLMGLVTDSQEGRLFSARSLPSFRRIYWNPYMTESGMEHLPHDGRHTCATLMESAGIPLVRRKLILGHAVSDITEGVYTHVKPEELIGEISKIKP